MPDSNAVPPQSPVVRRLTEEYAATLRAYLDGSEEYALENAYRVGQRALSDGFDVLEIASIHHQAMLQVLMGAAPELRREDAANALNLFCAACPAWFCEPVPAGRSVPIAAAWTVLVRSLTPAADHQRRILRSNSALLKLDEVREQEARRIAQSLHDDAAQLVAAAHLTLEDCGRRAGLAPEFLEPIRLRLDEIGDLLRTLSHELRPPVLDAFGLAAAIEALARGMKVRAGLDVTVEAPEKLRLPPPVETTLYRIVQEALRNVVRHARARSVTISITCDGQQAACSVRDDGVGFPVEATLAGTAGGGLGLTGIRERAEALGGTFRVSSAAAVGTEIRVRIPVADPAVGEPVSGGRAWLEGSSAQASK